MDIAPFHLMAFSTETFNYFSAWNIHDSFSVASGRLHDRDGGDVGFSWKIYSAVIQREKFCYLFSSNAIHGF